MQYSVGITKYPCMVQSNYARSHDELHQKSVVLPLNLQMIFCKSLRMKYDHRLPVCLFPQDVTIALNDSCLVSWRPEMRFCQSWHGQCSSYTLNVVSLWYYFKVHGGCNQRDMMMMKEIVVCKC